MWCELCSADTELLPTGSYYCWDNYLFVPHRTTATKHLCRITQAYQQLCFFSSQFNINGCRWSLVRIFAVFAFIFCRRIPLTTQNCTTSQMQRRMTVMEEISSCECAWLLLYDDDSRFQHQQETLIWHHAGAKKKPLLCNSLMPSSVVQIKLSKATNSPHLPWQQAT